MPPASRMEFAAAQLRSPSFPLTGRTKHGQQSRQREQIQTEIPEELPEPHSQSQRDAQRIERGGYVVAKEFGVAQQEAGLRVVVGVPARQRHDSKQQMKCVRASAHRWKNFFPAISFKLSLERGRMK